LAGHTVGTSLGTGSADLAPALAADANGSAVAITVQIAMGMNESLRIMSPHVAPMSSSSCRLGADRQGYGADDARGRARCTSASWPMRGDDCAQPGPLHAAGADGRSRLVLLP
jgi:hypothetical protein